MTDEKKILGIKKKIVTNTLNTKTNVSIVILNVKVKAQKLKDRLSQSIKNLTQLYVVYKKLT